MNETFESTPYDGVHPFLDPGNDWRDGNSPRQIFDREASYGNWAGYGNRAEDEHEGYVSGRRAADPFYDVTEDAAVMADPRYQPIDPVDAAAMHHDSRYAHLLGSGDMFSWEGMRAVREADRQLVSEVDAEMDAHGSSYSDDAESFTRGMRGFFGGRVMGMDAIDWFGDKAGEVGSGVGAFLGDAQRWDSVGDVTSGVAGGAADAFGWLGDTAGQAWGGLSSAAETTTELGLRGAYNVALGVGSAGLAGAEHLGAKAWSGVSSAAGDVWDWISG